jgi:hypothetical protein
MRVKSATFTVYHAKKGVATPFREAAVTNNTPSALLLTARPGSEQ